jgi:uncharacterized repeat protein (TIGR01451 family)
VTFTVQVTNNGPSTATGVFVADLLPAGLTLVSATASQGSYAGGTGAWNVGNLENGASATLTIIATVTQPGTITNSATITASSQPDPNVANNSASVTLVGQAADLRLTKSVNGSTPQIGGIVIYSLAVFNNGPSAATGVVVSDPLPAGLTFVSATPSQGSYNSTTGVWLVGALANGVSATLSIQVRVTASGPIVNTAQILAADQYDPNSAPANGDPNENDQAQVSISVPPTAIHLVSFTASPAATGVLVRWETALELNTWGFHVYRSASASRADAVRITPTLIAAQGRGQAGASYSWLDRSAVAGQVYSYWLIEIDTGGVTHEYGPATSAVGAAEMQYWVALPLVAR